MEGVVFLLSYGPFIKILTAALTPPEFRRLEDQARAELLRKLPYPRPLLAQGKCRAAIRHRMRFLLVGPSTLPAPRPPRPARPVGLPGPPAMSQTTQPAPFSHCPTCGQPITWACPPAQPRRTKPTRPVLARSAASRSPTTAPEPGAGAASPCGAGIMVVESGDSTSATSTAWKGLIE